MKLALEFIMPLRFIWDMLIKRMIFLAFYALPIVSLALGIYFFVKKENMEFPILICAVIGYISFFGCLFTMTEWDYYNSNKNYETYFWRFARWADMTR